MADEKFGGKLDLIIDTSDMPLFWSEGDKKFSLDSRITAVNTVFGWTVSGPAASDSKATTLTVDVLEDSDSKLLHQMYQLEKVPTATTLTDEEKSAVTQFEQSVQQTEDGRYSCKLPRVENPPPLGA